MKILIDIDAQFGSKFQEDLFDNTISAMMRALKIGMEDFHKKNKMVIKVKKNNLTTTY